MVKPGHDNGQLDNFAAKQGSLPLRCDLLRQAFDGEGSEFRVFLAYIPQLLAFGWIACGQKFFHAIPDLNDEPCLWRLAFESSDLLARYKVTGIGFTVARLVCGDFGSNSHARRSLPIDYGNVAIYWSSSAIRQ